MKKRLADNINSMSAAIGAAKAKKLAQPQIEILEKVAGELNGLTNASKKMISEKVKANEMEDVRNRAIAYCDKVKPLMEQVRVHADNLEQYVDDELWPLPKLREILFTR